MKLMFAIAIAINFSIFSTNLLAADQSLSSAISCGGPGGVLTMDPDRLGPEGEKLKRGLESKIVGQSDAINVIVRGIEASESGLRQKESKPNRPIGNYLLLGPTGTGKTHTAITLHQNLTGNYNIFRINCADYQQDHEIAKLLGPPPGYIGFKDTAGILNQAALDSARGNSKYTVILWDEIEKASPALFKLLLGILDDGSLVLANGTTTSFKNVINILSSNIGEAEIESLRGSSYGFIKGASLEGKGEIVTDKDRQKISNARETALRRKFSPEFINRLDAVVEFKTLGAKENLEIVNIEIAGLQEQIFKNNSGQYFKLEVSDTAKDFLIKSGKQEYNAREKTRAVYNYLESKLGNLLRSRQVVKGDRVYVDLNTENFNEKSPFTFKKTGSGLTTEEMGVPPEIMRPVTTPVAIDTQSNSGEPTKVRQKLLSPPAKPKNPLASSDGRGQPLKPPVAKINSGPAKSPKAPKTKT